jgi:hypothetical protein
MKAISMRWLLVVATPALLAAQTPEPNIAGTVKSIGGIPVAGLEVKLDGTTLTTRTDTRGAFSFTGAPKGTQDVIVRGIGYLPARITIIVPDRSLELAVTILPAPTALDTVKVKERINVLSGIVVDEMDKPVAGAKIDVITGDKKVLYSGEDGWFTLTSVREGNVVFRTTKEGFFMTNTTVRMNEWRGVVVHLESLPSKMGATAAADASGTSNNSSVAWRDTGLRLSMKSGRAVVISQEELAPVADLPLSQAVGQTKSGQLLSIDLERMRGNICVLVDGRRAVGNTTLDSWRGGDVDMIELYPPGTEASGTAAKYMRGSGCRAFNGTGLNRAPFFAVLWLK